MCGIRDAAGTCGVAKANQQETEFPDQDTQHRLSFCHLLTEPRCVLPPRIRPGARVVPAIFQDAGLAF